MKVLGDTRLEREENSLRGQKVRSSVLVTRETIGQIFLRIVFFSFAILIFD